MSIVMVGANEAASRWTRRSSNAALTTQRLPQQIAKRVLTLSLDLVPVDTGELRRSARIVIVPIGAEVQYLAPHAYVVHEDLEAYHPLGQAKFLSRAVALTRQEMAKLFADTLKR